MIKVGTVQCVKLERMSIQERIDVLLSHTSQGLSENGCKVNTVRDKSKAFDCMILKTCIWDFWRRLKHSGYFLIVMPVHMPLYQLQ